MSSIIRDNLTTIDISTILNQLVECNDSNSTNENDDNDGNSDNSDNSDDTLR